LKKSGSIEAVVLAGCRLAWLEFSALKKSGSIEAPSELPRMPGEDCTIFRFEKKRLH